jgi:hypothetical protein
MRASLVAVVYLFGVACSNSAGVFGGDGSGSGASGSGAGQSGSGGTTSSGGQGGTTVSTSDGATVGQAGPQTAAVTSVQTTSTAAQTVASSATGGGSVMVDCDLQSCDVTQGQACCWDQYQLYKAPQAQCVKVSEANACITNGGESRVLCDEPGDCEKGKVCCGHRKTFFANGQQFAYYDIVQCQSTCDYPDIVLCVPNITTCPMLPKQGGGFVQGVCKQSSLLPQGYNVCGYP